MIDFAFYAFLLAGAVFLATWLLTKKDKNIAVVVTVIVGLLVVGFAFPSTQHASDLADVANNVSLGIGKLFYGAVWGITALLLHKFLP